MLWKCQAEQGTLKIKVYLYVNSTNGLDVAFLRFEINGASTGWRCGDVYLQSCCAVTVRLVWHVLHESRCFPLKSVDVLSVKKLASSPLKVPGFVGELPKLHSKNTQSERQILDGGVHCGSECLSADTQSYSF